MNQLSITALCIMFNFVVLSAIPLQEPQHREKTDFHPHKTATNNLLTEYSGLTDTLKENIVRILNISNNSSLDSDPLKTALSTMCTMKHIIDTLAATKVAVTDLEISVVQVLTTKLYYHSCELMVQEVKLHGSLMTIDTTCLPLTEQTINDTNNHNITETTTTTSETTTETTTTTSETTNDSTTETTNETTTETTTTTSETTTDSTTDTTSGVVNDLCSYWHTLKLAEATETDLTTLLMALRNEENK